MFALFFVFCFKKVFVFAIFFVPLQPFLGFRNK